MDLHTASVCLNLRNAWRGENQRPYELEQFMLFPMGFSSEDPREQTEEEMIAACKRFALASGGEVLERGS